MLEPVASGSKGEGRWWRWGTAMTIRHETGRHHSWARSSGGSAMAAAAARRARWPSSMAALSGGVQSADAVPEQGAAVAESAGTRLVQTTAAVSI